MVMLCIDGLYLVVAETLFDVLTTNRKKLAAGHDRMV